MVTKQNIRLGLLSPATPNRPHFKHVDSLLPPGVSLIREGLGLLGESYQDLAGKTDQVIAIATDFVKRNEVEGIDPDRRLHRLVQSRHRCEVSEAIRLPVVAATFRQRLPRSKSSSRSPCFDNALRCQIRCDN